MKIYLKKRNPFPRENEKKKFSKKTFPPVILFIKVINLNILVIHSRNVTTATQFLDLRTFKWKIDVIEKFDFMFWYEIQFAMLSLKCHSRNAEKKQKFMILFIENSPPQNNWNEYLRMFVLPQILCLFGVAREQLLHRPHVIPISAIPIFPHPLATHQHNKK